MRIQTIALLITCLTGLIQIAHAQRTSARPTQARIAAAPADKWTGTWRMVYKPWPHIPAITMELQIGESSYHMLYPALLKLDYPPFSGVYEVLLARKNDQQLGIGRGKYPIKETPFKLRSWMLYLNGTFDYGKGSNAMPVLNLHRMWINAFGLFMHGLYADDEIFVNTKVALRDFLYRDSIQLKKINNKPWNDPHTRRILHPEEDSIYFGIYEKIMVKDSIAHITIIDKDQLDRDTVTLVHNGQVLMNSMEINAQTREQQIRLDTGMNIFSFFADNYGGLPPNTGDMRVNIDSGKYSFDFSDGPNAFATFLVAQFYREPGITVPPPLQDTLQRTAKATTRQDEWVTSLVVKQANITLELWDGQTEDGDSISLRLNDTWIASGFAVKKKVQQINVTLQRGENRLLFMADNLGSIPPNTAVLRIRFGEDAKTVELNTDLKRNNMIRIVYEE
ncbi:hypothetical protein [Chitinophaga sp. MM2321]|uniref:hypothetical protein n=1 Tax=Chitinophaga sp. MM2321 TaxID=3137178 RepID=UPI0032D576E2